MEGEAPTPGRLPAGRAVAALDHSHDAMIIMGPDGTIEWANQAVTLLGYDPEPLVGQSVFGFVHPEDLDRAAGGFVFVRDGSALRAPATYRVVRGDGGNIECDVSAWSLGDDPGILVHVRPTHHARVFRDTLQRLLSGEEPQAVLDSVLELIGVRNEWVRCGVSFLDDDGATQRAGADLPPELVPPEPLVARFDPDAPMAGVLVENGEDLPHPVQRMASDAGLGSCWIFPVDPEAPMAAVVSLWVLAGGPPAHLNIDSVAQLRQLGELVLRWHRNLDALRRAATSDPLTGLANRRAVTEGDAATSGPAGVLFIDLDNLKHVNDSHGHSAGDHVLAVVAARLVGSVRAVDTVARLGGDEFGVICRECSDEELEATAARLRAVVKDPIAVEGVEVSVTASIGIASGDEAPAQLIEAADRAMYRAKIGGKDAAEWAPSRG